MTRDGCDYPSPFHTPPTAAISLLSVPVIQAGFAGLFGRIVDRCKKFAPFRQNSIIPSTSELMFVGLIELREYLEMLDA